MNLKLVLTLLVNLVVYTLAFERPVFKPPGKEPPTSDKPEDRIINGFTPGRFDNPHVALLNVTFAGSGGICTGSLLSSGWLITAGHCAQGAQSIQVQLGLFNRAEEPAQRITVARSNIFVHPNFISNATDTINDLALLRLNPRANIFLRSIRSIPFACAIAGSFAGRTGQACGWGITSDTAANITNILQCVNMPIITNTECQQRWGNEVRPTNICTRTVNQRTACHGDSGGPLVVTHGLLQRRKLVGATSFGSDPCAGTAPDVFARVASFTEWIRTTTGILCDLL